MVPLGEVADVTAGNPAPQEQIAFCDSGIPFVRMQDVGRYRRTDDLQTTTDRIKPSWPGARTLKLFPVGTTLIPKSGASINLNHRAMLGTSAFVVSHLAALIPRRDVVEPRFIYWWSTTWDPRDQAQTTSLPSLPLSIIQEARVPLPPRDEQRRIVDLLDRAAGIRRLREAALAKARDTTPALFLSMFGDPDTNPLGWPVSPLGNILANSMQNGLYRPASDYGEGTPILRIDNFAGGEIVGSKGLKRVRVEAAAVALYGLRTGDFLINRVNSPSHLGKSVLVGALDEPAVFESNMLRFALDQSRLRSEVFLVMLQLPQMRVALTRNAKHAINQSSINQRDVAALRVPCPPPRLQREFANRWEQLRSIIAQQERAFAIAQEAERALMARLLG
nr:restriction endonuclease subunit S [Roseococcus sp. MDT2-1-1]